MSMGVIEVSKPAADRARRDVIECVEPATRARLGEVRVDAPESLAGIVARARAAQTALQSASFAKRQKLLERLLAHVVDHAGELVDLLCRVSGKTRENAMMGEIWPIAEKIRWTIAHGKEHLSPERVSSGLFPHKRASIVYRPRGVLGAIVAWNYPLQNVLNPAITALMAGNAVVIKASEWVAWASARIQRIFDEALEAEGFSKDLVRVVNGYGETGAALVRSGVDIVLFIGSVPNGRRVLAASAENITPVILELGGKDPLIVCDDADLDQSVHAALGGCFINAGQNCVASERILVEDGIYGRFEARVAEHVRAFRQGPPLEGSLVDMGAMATPLQLDVVKGLVERAIAAGARVVTGGAPVLTNDGYYFAPTILADVTPEMEIMQEEMFGPVMLLCRVHDDDHAVEVANGTRFGLSSTVMSRNPKRARAIVDRLEAGMSSVNEFGGITYMVQDLPFGGVKQSGFGRMNGRDGLRALTHPTAVLEDRLPIHVPSKLFPVAPATAETVQSVVEMLYGPSLGQRLRGAKRMVSALFNKG